MVLKCFLCHFFPHFLAALWTMEFPGQDQIWASVRTYVWCSCLNSCQGGAWTCILVLQRCCQSCCTTGGSLSTSTFIHTRKARRSCDLPYCGICFMAVVWNWTHDISESYGIKEITDLFLELNWPGCESWLGYFVARWPWAGDSTSWRFSFSSATWD